MEAMVTYTTKFFQYNVYYLSDYAGNVAGPYNTFDEACEDAVESDTILQTFAPKVIKKSAIKAITLDFTKNELVVEGDAITLNNTSYDKDVVHSLDSEELKEWSKIIEDCYKVCPDTVVIGNPPVEGVNLNEMLHL